MKLRDITFAEKEAFYRDLYGGPSEMRHKDADGTIREYTEEEWRTYVKDAPHPDLQTLDMSYFGKRVAAYPNDQDQLDTIWKALRYMKANGVDLGPEANEMADLITHIKTTISKPEGLG